MEQVTDILSSRLNIGGRWYGRGDPVRLNLEDAEVYRSRGLSSPAPAGTQPKNVEKLPAQSVAVVTKDAEKAPPQDTKPDADLNQQTTKGRHDGKRSR